MKRRNFVYSLIGLGGLSYYTGINNQKDVEASVVFDTPSNIDKPDIENISDIRFNLDSINISTVRVDYPADIEINIKDKKSDNVFYNDVIEDVTEDSDILTEPITTSILGNRLQSELSDKEIGDTIEIPILIELIIDEEFSKDDTISTIIEENIDILVSERDEFILYRDERDNDNWSTEHTNNSNSTEYNEDYIMIRANENFSRNVLISKKVDLTEYNKLIGDIYNSQSIGSSSSYFGVATEVSGRDAEWSEKVEYSGSDTLQDGIEEIDVSSLSGEHHVVFYIDNARATAGSLPRGIFEIYNVKLI